MLFMPSPITGTSDPFLTHIHSDFYENARKYVENGGFLYASVASDGAIPDMASLFGARLVDRAPSSEVTLKIVAPFGELKPGDTFHYTVPTQTIESWGTLLEVTSGRVIAVDQNNNPALVANSIGRGKTLAAGGAVICLWDVASGRVLPGSADPFLGMIMDLRFGAGRRRSPP